MCVICHGFNRNPSNRLLGIYYMMINDILMYRSFKKKSFFKDF